MVAARTFLRCASPCMDVSAVPALPGNDLFPLEDLRGSEILKKLPISCLMSLFDRRDRSPDLRDVSESFLLCDIGKMRIQLSPFLILSVRRCFQVLLGR